MKKVVVAVAIVLGLSVFGSIMNVSAPLSYAQDNPEPEKPEKPQE